MGMSPPAEKKVKRFTSSPTAFLVLAALVVVVAAAAVPAAKFVSAAPVASSAADPPTQVRLALGDNVGTSVVVSWITTADRTGEVLYGTTTNPSNKVSQASSAESYSYDSRFGEHYTSGLIHFVNVTGLKPSTLYYYKCGSVSGGYSKVFSFTTPPLFGSESISINFIGDLGQTVNSSSTMAHIRSDDKVKMTVLVGDISYADSAEESTPGHNCTQRRWDSWGLLSESTFANQPLMVLPGNHEIEYNVPPATQTSFLAYLKRFLMPYESSGASSNLYYSFNVGPAHIIMLNSYMDFGVNSPQYAWLEQDLKGINRKVTPWVIAAMHAPWYNSDKHHHNEPEEVGMRQFMEPLMYTYNVDIIFSGHVHAYERMYPVYENETRPDAPTYINIGDGGNREGPATGYYPQPSWSAYREPAFGHGVFDIVNSTHAYWGWHKNMNEENVVSDSVWLVKNSALDESLYTRGLSHVQGRNFDGYAPYKTF